jgi:hypothetical protein
MEAGDKRVRGCAAAWQKNAEWLGGAAGVASACDGPRVQARERACELKDDSELAPSGCKSTARAVPRLPVAERRRARLRSRDRETTGSGFTPSLANECTCAGARAHGLERRCVRARLEATAMATARTTAATRQLVERVEEQERKDGHRGAGAAKTAAAPERKDIPAWLDGRHHTA